MIAKVEFDSFTRISDYVKQHPLHVRLEYERRKAEPASSSAGKWTRQESLNSSSFQMAELPVAS
jgi:hypothetical protein